MSRGRIPTDPPTPAIFRRQPLPALFSPLIVNEQSRLVSEAGPNPMSHSTELLQSGIQPATSSYALELGAHAPLTTGPSTASQPAAQLVNGPAPSSARHMSANPPSSTFATKPPELSTYPSSFNYDGADGNCTIEAVHLVRCPVIIQNEDKWWRTVQRNLNMSVMY
jgi:hypothetical protein